jgi:LPS export ABC transporter permease LptG
MLGAGLLMLGWRARWADQPVRLRLPAWWPGRRSVDPTDGPGAPAPRRVVLVVRVPHLNVPGPRLLDMYLGREYFRVLLLAGTSLLGIFYIATFIDLVDKLLRGDTTSGMLLQYFYFQTPQFVYYVIPMAVLVATLVSIGILSKNSELMVMRACGVSLYRTAAPLVVFALAASAMLYVLQERVLAQTKRQADRLERIIRKWPALSNPLDRRWVVGADGSIYHYDFFDARADHFSRLHIYRLDQPSWTLRSITFARDAAPARPADSDEGPIAWKIHQGWVREVQPASAGGTGGVAVTYTPFAERHLSLEPPKYFKSDTPDPDMMTYGQLQDFIARLGLSGADSGRYQVALQRKIAFPLVTLVMTLLAVPFAVMTGRRGAMYGIGAAIVIAIVYWTSMSVLAAVGAGGLLPPTLAAWAPNLLFAAAAAYLILTART